ITTNHKTRGIYLPADDRRHFVAWSDASKQDCDAIWNWYEAVGLRNVAAYLATLDLSGFNPKAPPPKTPAFLEMVDAGRAPEDDEFADALEKLATQVINGEPVLPDAVTVADIIDKSTDQNFIDWLRDRRNSRQIPYRFEETGYVTVRNNDDKRDGQWRIKGR